MAFDKKDTNIIKALAISLMLYHHLFGFPERLYGNWFISIPLLGGTSAYIIGVAAKMCVNIFVFLTGYGLYLNYKGNFKYILKRIWGMYKMYWKVFAISVPLFFIICDLKFDLRQFIYNFIGVECSYNYEWWFFMAYILLMLIYPIIYKCVNWDKKNICVDLVLVTILMLGINWFVRNYGYSDIMVKIGRLMHYDSLAYTLTIIPSLALGSVFAKYEVLNKVKEYTNNKYYFSILALIALPLILLYEFKLGNTRYDTFTSVALIICFYVFLNNKLGDYIKPLLNKIGERSSYIWLTHSFFCYYWFRYYTYLPRYSPLIFLCLLIVSYVYSELIIRLFDLLESFIKKNEKRKS